MDHKKYKGIPKYKEGPEIFSVIIQSPAVCLLKKQ